MTCEFQDKNIVVLGYGKSGKSAARLALYQDAIVTVYDEKHISEDTQIEGVQYLLFDEETPPLTSVDLIIISPGIDPSKNFAQWAIASGAEIVSELEFASYFAQSPMLAVTGTNGKTTTVELCTHLLNALGVEARSVGNIGEAFCGAVYEAIVRNQFPQVWVVEVSSFQLEFTNAFAPLGAVLLNVTSDHINRYEGFDDYKQTKLKIFKHIPAQNAILHITLLDDYEEIFNTKCQPLSAISGLTRWRYEKPYIVRHNENEVQKIVTLKGTKLKGDHNIENTLAALQLIEILNPALLNETERVQIALNSFNLGGHRIEIIADQDGKLFINDSKATNPDAVLAALNLYGGIRNVRLILGGLDKEMDFSLLLPGSGSVICAYIYGSCRERIAEAIDELIPVEVFELFDDAVLTALKDLEKGEVLLLSPACASMDQFSDYQARGNRFRDLVMNYLAGE